MLLAAAPADIDTVLGVFIKTLVKLEKRADWLVGERVRLEDELVQLRALENQHSVEQSRINTASGKIREIVGG